jgi:hypothetical protein
MDPTDENLIAFAHSMVEDDTEPFLAPEILPKAVAKNRDLWVMLYRVSNGLEHVPVGYGDRFAAQAAPRARFTSLSEAL